MYVANVIPSIKETENNVRIFEHNIRHYGDTFRYYVATTISLEDESRHYQNLASMMAWHDKRLFLSILLDHTPGLLWQRVFENKTDSVCLTTPLDAAIHARNPSLVRHILDLAQMKQYKEENREGYNSLIKKGMDNARLWYKNNEENEQEILRALIVV